MVFKVMPLGAVDADGGLAPGGWVGLDDGELRR